VADTQQKALASTTSVQPRFQSHDDIGHGVITMLRTGTDAVYPYGDTRRDVQTQDMVHLENILIGAISTMVQKMCGLNWIITGGRNRVRRYSRILSDAEGGNGWSNWLSKIIWDYLTHDNGSYIELGRQGRGVNGPVADIYHMDSFQMRTTGNVDFPYIYSPSVRTRGSRSQVRMPSGSVVRLASMPSTEEKRLGLGFCAASRALRAANLLLTLNKYGEEKLTNMPPQGIASITGMTIRQVHEAMNLYEEERKKRNQLTYGGLLWLANAMPGGQEVAVQLTEFSSMPDGFDYQTMVEIYVNIVALCLGVDTREIWPATQTGATKADALVQAQKAKGKGVAELINTIERAINFHVLPEGVEFAFDFTDDEEDLRRAEIQGRHIINVVALYQPASPMLPEGLVTREEARQLLASYQVLPEEMVQANESVETDTDARKSFLFYDDGPRVKVRWKGGGVFNENRWDGWGNLREDDGFGGALDAAERRLLGIGAY